MAGLLDDNPFSAAAQALPQGGAPADTVTPSTSALPANPNLVAVNPYAAAAVELPQTLQEQSETQMEQVLEDEAAAREARAEAARTEAARKELRVYEAISRQTRQQIDRIGNADIIAEVRRISREERLPMPYAAETYMDRVRERDDQAYSELMAAEPALARLARLTESYPDFRQDGFGLATAVAATREAFTAAQARPDEYDPSTWSGDLQAGIMLLEAGVRGTLAAWSTLEMGGAQGSAAAITALIPEYYGLTARIAELDAQLGITSGERPRLENRAELEAEYVDLTAQLNQMSLYLAGRTPEEAIADAEASELSSARSIALQALEISQLNAAAGAIDMTPAATRLAQAETMEEALTELFADPGGVIRSFGLRALPSMAPPLLAAAAGQLIGGPAGAALLSATFGGGVEFGATVADELSRHLQDAGLDVTDPAAVTAWAQANQDEFAAILDRAAARAVIIMVAEGASGFTIGRLTQLSANSGRVRRVVTAAAGAPIEGGTEAGGSAAASLILDGELPAAGETLAEFLGGFALGTPQASLQAGAEAVRRSRTEQRLLDALDAARNEQLTRAEETQAALETAQAAVTETRTFDQDPEAVRELLAEEDAGAVAVPAAEIERLYEEGQLTDEDIEYLQIEDEMTQQGELSGDVSIERSRILTMRPEAFTPLAEHVRVTPDAVTTAEARANIEALEADVARLQAQMESMQADMDGVAQLSDDIRALIPATPGVSSRQTRAVADLLAERYAARAANFGPEVTARSLFEDDRLAFETEGRGAPTPALEQAAASLQRTPEFQTWFGDSKVVDENGDPLVVYHATDEVFDAFDFSRLGSFTRANATSEAATVMAETGVWANTGDISERTAQDVVMPLFMLIQNPLEISFDDLWSLSGDYENGAELRARLQADGYDGLAVEDTEFGGTSYVAFSPEQIKSIFNEAPTTDPRILYQPAIPRTAAERLTEGRKPPREPRGNTYMGVGEQYTVANPSPDAPAFVRNGGMILNSTNEGNADAQSAALDALLEAHPDPLASEEAWVAFANDAFSLTRVPMPPWRTINIVNEGPSALGAELDKLSEGMVRDAEAGLKTAQEFGEVYASGQATPDVTAKAFLWSFLSRGVSPYVQEGAFLDAITSPVLTDIMQRASVEGWSQSLNAEYTAWAESAIPPGSPGRGTQHNLNAFGRNFMTVMTRMHPDAGDRTGLQIIHDMIADGTPSAEIRREFLKRGSGAGIDNKVVSFTLLLLGRTDVLVLDRVQVRNQFNDGRFDGQNIYDAEVVNEKQVTGSAFAAMTFGHKGLLYYEAMERALQPIIEAAYAERGMEGSLGRYHWDSWLAASNQEVGHASVEGLLRDAQGTEQPYAGAFVRQGKYTNYDYGFRYGILPDGSAATVVETLDGAGAIVLPHEVVANDKHPTRKTLSSLASKAKKRGSEYGVTQPWTAALTAEEQAKYDEAIRSAGSPAPDFWADPADAVRPTDATGQEFFQSVTRDVGDEGTRRTSGGDVVLNGRATTASAIFGGTTERPVYEITDPALFGELINEAKAALGPIGAQVTAYDDYTGKRLFVFDDGASGFALDGDDIISVFSIPSRAPQGAGQRVLELAVAEGGRRLDAFDTYLPKVYERGGFRAVAALPFDTEYAPPGWDYDFFAESFPETGGQPDVVFMVYDPANANRATDNEVADYDAGLAAQTEALAEVAPPELEQARRTPTGPQTDTKGAVGAPRGSYVPPTSADPRNLIRLATTADVTTFVHESGHMFLFQMMQDLNDSRLTEEGRATLTKQIESTRRWFGQNVDQAFADLKRMAASAEKAAAALPDGPEKQQATTRASRLRAAYDRAAKKGGPQYMRRVAESFMDPTATGYDEAAEVVFHELWARGFEQYMGTGNAPTSELQKLFARFSKFITSIYSSLRRLNVEITPEISDVFDRLVASEEAVAAERRGAIYQIPLGLMDQATPAEAQRLRELAAEAETEGQIQMQKRVATSLRNEEVARRKERRRQLTDEITTQVENEPVYAAITIARTGKRPDGHETGMGRLSYAEVVAASSEQAASSFPAGTVGGKRSKIKNPVSLAMLRDLAGFTSTDELVTAMTQPDLPSKQERVRQLVDEQMLQEFGSDIDPRQLQSQAIEVIQNEKFQQLQAVLTRVLRRLASEPMERVAQRQVEREGAPAAAVDREAVAEARQAQERAATPRETIEASLQRIRADVQRRANASGRRAQFAAKSKTAAIRRGIDPEAIKEAAHRFVRQSKVGTMTPRRYRQAAVRLTAKIERAIAARDYAEAARLMEQRAMNLAIAEQAAAVQSTVEAQRKRWRNLLARPDKKLAASYDMDHVNTIRALLEPFDFARAASRNYDANQALATLATTEPDLYAELKADLTQFASIHQRTQQADPKAPYRDLTVREMEDALALADRLLAGARDSHGLLIEGQRVSFDKISAEVAANVQQRSKVQKNLRANEIGRGNKRQRDFRRAISSFKAMLTRVELWARNFDNDNPNGPLTQYLVRPVMAAIDTYTAKRRDVQSQLISLLKQHRKLMGTKPISAPELGGYRFQHKGELIMAMLHTGNPSNKRKLLLGGAVDIATGKRYEFGVERSDGSLDSTRWDAFVDRMFAEGTLTKEDMDLVQGIWDLFEQTKQPAQAAHKRMYGYYFTEIEAEPIQTPFGTYKGGYAPAVTDTMMSLDGDRFEAEQVMSQQANAAMFPGAEKGFTIGRTDYRGALDLDLSRIPAHLDRVLKFAYLGPAVRNAARLVKHRAFAEAVRPGSPDIIDVAIIPWLQRTAQQRVSQPPTNRGWSGVNRVANAVNNRVGLHLMAGNLVNAAQQITGFFPAAAVVGPRHLAVALSTWRMDSQSARKHILSQSEFMRERLTDGANEAALTLDATLSEPGLLKTPQRLAMRLGYFAQQLSQNMIDPTVWLAAERKGNETLYPEVYAKVLDETGDEALAATKARAAVSAYADQVIRDTQSPMRASDVSAIEASTPLARLFLKFYNYFNNMGNLLTTQISISQNRQDLNWLGRQGRSFYAYLMIAALPSIVAEAMSMWARGDLDELEEDEVDEVMFQLLVGSQIKTVAAMVPYAGQVAGTVYGTAVTDAPYDDRLSMPAGVGMVGTNVTGITQLLMAAADPNTDVDTRRAIRTAMDSIAILTGLPTNWASKGLQYAAQVHSGEAQPQGLTDYVQGALTGRDGTER